MKQTRCPDFGGVRFSEVSKFYGSFNAFLGACPYLGGCPLLGESVMRGSTGSTSRYLIFCCARIAQLDPDCGFFVYLHLYSPHMHAAAATEYYILLGAH